MKQVLIVTVALGVACAASSAARGLEAAIAQDIESASAVFFSDGEPSSRAAAQKALADLVESASQISVDANLPAPAQERLAVAAASFAGGGFLEREAVATVHRAYEAVNGGQAFTFPQDVGSIEEAKEHGRRQIRKALEALDAERPREAVQKVLGFVLLVTTPMEKPK